MAQQAAGTACRHGLTPTHHRPRRCWRHVILTQVKNWNRLHKHHPGFVAFTVRDFVAARWPRGADIQAPCLGLDGHGCPHQREITDVDQTTRRGLCHSFNVEAGLTMTS